MASMPRVQEGSSKAPSRRRAWLSTSQPVPARYPATGLSADLSIAILSNNYKNIANGLERSYGASSRDFAAHPKAVYSFGKELGLLPNLRDDEACGAVFG